MANDDSKRNWTVEGVDAEAAAVAKAAATSAGVPVSEWLSRVILESTTSQEFEAAQDEPRARNKP